MAETLSIYRRQITIISVKNVYHGNDGKSPPISVSVTPYDILSNCFITSHSHCEPVSHVGAKTLTLLNLFWTAVYLHPSCSVPT